MTNDPNRNRHNSAIAHLANAINNNWHIQGLTTTLQRLNNRPLPEVAIATLIAAATRPDQTTPSVIAFEGRHWDHTRTALGQHTQPNTPPQPNPPPTCPHGLTPSSSCQRCADHYRATAKRGAPRVRQAIRAGREGT